jgi:ADP-ribose pyrophosphatase
VAGFDNAEVSDTPPLPRLVSSSIAYNGHLFDVALDMLAMPNGVETRREIIKHPGAVCMIPVDAEGRLLLVTQYRHAAGKRLLELPAGTLEPGEDPQLAAIRELQEEVGQRPGRVQPIGGFFVAPGYTTEYIHLFVCDELHEDALDGDDDEDIEIEPTTLDEALRQIEVGGIVDAKSVIGVLRYARLIHR